jgi:hypothetical protein
MIIWTTAGLFSLVEDENPYYVVIEARDVAEADTLRSTLRLVDLEDEIDDEFQTPHGYALRLLKTDAQEWLRFEFDHWMKEPLARQFGKLEDTRSAIALEKLLMNLEK